MRFCFVLMWPCPLVLTSLRVCSRRPPVLTSLRVCSRSPPVLTSLRVCSRRPPPPPVLTSLHVCSRSPVLTSLRVCSKRPPVLTSLHVCSMRPPVLTSLRVLQVSSSSSPRPHLPPSLCPPVLTSLRVCSRSPPPLILTFLRLSLSSSRDADQSGAQRVARRHPAVRRLSPRPHLPPSLSVLLSSPPSVSLCPPAAMQISQERSESLADTQPCAGCRQPITERFLLRALDQFWHEDCLKCSCCDCRLGEVGSTLFSKANLLLCRRDYLR